MGRWRLLSTVDFLVDGCRDESGPDEEVQSVRSASQGE